MTEIAKCKFFYESYDPPVVTVECACPGKHEGDMSFCIRDARMMIMDIPLANAMICSTADVMQLAVINYKSTSIEQIKNFLLDPGAAKLFQDLENQTREIIRNTPVIR